MARPPPWGAPCMVGFGLPLALITSFVTTSDALLVAPILIVVGAILAALSAKFAITRYLKV